MAATKAPARKKPAAAKPAARKPAAPKAAAAAKKAPAKAAPAKPAVKEKMTKTGILSEIATNTGLSRKQVGSVMDELESIIDRHIKKRGPGEFSLPGLLKIKTVKKPAQRARKGVPNPFKPGETMDVPAKPASVRVKVTPLKKLKEMAQ
ncbi:MAG: HU family DNA-binding protein [Gammaproteobacteria bacterium]|nr:HU family DNA-binding protein [Gammaproteobacteria bacterium]